MHFPCWDGGGLVLCQAALHWLSFEWPTLSWSPFSASIATGELLIYLRAELTDNSSSRNFPVWDCCWWGPPSSSSPPWLGGRYHKPGFGPNFSSWVQSRVQFLWESPFPVSFYSGDLGSAIGSSCLKMWELFLVVFYHMHLTPQVHLEEAVCSKGPKFWKPTNITSCFLCKTELSTP